MKKYLILFLLVLYSCSSGTKIEQTKYYVGKYETSFVDGKHTKILTSDAIVTIKGDPNIPEGSICYIRVAPMSYDMHPDIAWRMEEQYFSWVGSEEYKIAKNIKLK